MSFKYNNLTPFKWCIIQNFPFIEADFDAITNYQLFCKVVEYLNKTIDSTNILGQKVQEFAEYFENLDVQEEIDNKLDEYVKDGTFDNYIGKYINPYLSTFNSRLNEQDLKINAVENGSPLVASSVSQMTDTSKVYVNTTNGYWYYYNGNEWTQGGIYQASQPSDELLKYGSYIPQMINGVVYGNIYITVDDENITIDITGQEQLFLISKKPIQIQPIQKIFSLTDYPITTKGIWALIVKQDKTIDIVNIFNNNLNYNDSIIMIFASKNSKRFSLINENLYYNNKRYFTIESFVRFIPKYIKDIIYGSVNIINDGTNLTVKLNPNGQPSPIFITENQIYNLGNDIELETTFPLSEYNINAGGTWNLIYDSEDKIFRLLNIASDPYILKYSDIILITICYAGKRILTECQSNLYYNNKDITIQGIKDSLNKEDFDFLRCFKNFTFIGDSLTAGYTSVDGHTINSATAKAQNNNWCSYLCSRLNRNYNNLGVGSSTIENWRYGNQSGQPESNIENANIESDIYFVGLGVNDLRKGLTVGSIDDINTNDYTQNINSVYGNYDYIINKLKSFNPYAKIFVFTIPNSENNPQNINEAIRYVASLYDNVYCIDLYNIYDFNSGFIANNFTNGHYNPITYNYMSVLIEKAVNNYIFENSTNFDLVPYNYN